MSAGLIHVEAFSAVTFNVESYFDEFNSTDNQITDATYGSIISFDTQLASQAGYTFKYWVINDVVELNSSIDDTFPVVEGMSVKALFSPSDSHLVVYMDSNGKYLDLEYVSDGGTALADGSYDMPTKPGYQVTTEVWDKPLTNITEDCVMVLQYEKTSVDSYDLTVNSGTGSGAYDYNTTVTVVADAPAGGTVFSHWEDELGNTVSLNSSYTFTMLSDRTVTAVYDVSAPSDAPVLGTVELALRNGYYSYLSQAYVPDGSTLIEFGVITSVAEQAPLNYDNAEHILRSTLMNSTTGEYLSSIPKDHYYARSFMVTKDGSEVITVTYGPLITHSSTKTPMILDFEDESKGDYDSGTLTIDGNDWYLEDSGIWKDSGDAKYGDKSIRIRNTGSISSEFVFESGIDSIHFLYGLYGSDPASVISVQYAYEWDPTNWYEVEISPENYEINIDTTELTAITVDMNITSSIYLKIAKLSGTDRINLDNIIINSGTYTDSNNPVLGGIVTSATITEGDSYDPIAVATAVDFYDGDITGDITTVTKDSEQTVITNPVDYTALAPGTYTVDVTITDSDADETTATITLTVESASSYVAVGTELFISEYIEGGSYNKAIEIYNPTDHSIDLSDYTLERYSNGSSTVSGSVTLVGTLAPGEVYVVYHASAGAEIKAVGDLESSDACNFNGDDAIALRNNGTLIDIIGVIGEQAVWSAGTGDTQNNTLVRNPDVYGGNTTWTSSEWTSYSQDTFDYLGSHTVTPPA